MSISPQTRHTLDLMCSRHVGHCAETNLLGISVGHFFFVQEGKPSPFRYLLRTRTRARTMWGKQKVLRGRWNISPLCRGARPRRLRGHFSRQEPEATPCRRLRRRGELPPAGARPPLWLVPVLRPEKRAWFQYFFTKIYSR